MSDPSVSLITVNYNGRPYLEALFESVHVQDFPSERLEVIVVDNGSTDGSVELVRATYPNVKVIENTANLGFARANNQGAAVATGRYLALLNNDTRLEPSWVSRMVACLESSPPDVVCAGSTMLNWDGSLIDFGGATLAFNGIGFQTNASLPPDVAAPVDSEEIPFACGGALMIERDVYLDAGGFDDDFFAYLEDVDFGWRLWVLGYRVVFCPDAVVYHRHNATSSLFDDFRKTVLIERNALYSVIKNYDDMSLTTVLGASLLLALKRAALRSGIPRADFRFTPAQPGAPGRPSLRVSPTGEPVLWAFLRVWRDEGSTVALRKSLHHVRALIGRKTRTGARRPVAEGTRPIRRESYATVVAIEDLIDDLPALLEKRRRIQADRKRSDGDIFRIFGTPFKPPGQPSKHRAAYESAHEGVINALGVRDYFEARTSSASENLADQLAPDGNRTR